MIRVSQVKIRTEHTIEQLQKKVAELLKIPVKDIRQLTIVRQSIDARKKPDIYYIYTLDIQVTEEEKLLKNLRKKGKGKVRTIRFRRLQ